MIPVDKVREIISKHKILEKELSSDKVDKKKFAKISKEYSDLNGILNNAKEYLSFDETARDLEKIINDSKSDLEMKDLAKLELSNLINENKNHEKKLKVLLNSSIEDATLAIDLMRSLGMSDQEIFDMIVKILPQVTNIPLRRFLRQQINIHLAKTAGLYGL
mgnify:CR=1 FL=1